MQFHNSGTAGNASIGNFGDINFFNSSTAGNASIANYSNMNFRDDSSAGGSSIKNYGTINLTFASTTGSANIVNYGVMSFYDMNTAGNASITNNGIISLSGISTGGNANITNNNTLKFSDHTTAGNASITNTSVVDFSGTSSAGNAAITNNYFLRFYAASTAGNATITTHNFAAFYDTSTAGSATIINDNYLNFYNNSTGGNANIITTYNLAFTDGSTAGNATITNKYDMQFLAGSTAGNSAIFNEGTLLFANTSTGGNAAIANSAGGLVDFSSSTGPANDGKLTIGSIAGAGNFYLGLRELSVGGNNLNTTVGGTISDCGPTGTQCLSMSGPTTGTALIKVGTGTLTLAGVNTYTGATAINAGSLVVDGSIATSTLTSVNSGGTLAGIGTVGNTQVNAGGIFAPGNGLPGSAMTVAGNLAFQSGGIYLVQIDSKAASLANATTANLTGGNVQANFAPGGSAARQYTILHTTVANGLGGTRFAGLSGSASGFDIDLNYVNDQDVILGLTAVLGRGNGLNRNQQNVADALNGFFNNGGVLPPNFVGTFGLTGNNLGNALSLLSGETATGAQQSAFQLGSQFLGLMIDPFVNGRGGTTGTSGAALGFAPERPGLPEDIALAYARITKAPIYKAPPPGVLEQPWNIWGGGFGGYNNTDGDPTTVGSHDLSARTAGFAAGMDYRVTPDTTMGFALAGGGTRWDLAQGLGGGRSSAFQAGVYSATRAGPAYLAGSFAFSNHWLSTDRAAPFGNRLTADFDAQSFGGRIEGGWRFGSPGTGVTPYAAVQAQNFHTPTYSETDVTSGGFGLTYNSRNASDIRSELGARFDHVALVNPSAVLTLRGRLAWAHDWVSDPSLVAAFQTLPGASFVVNGAMPAKDSALVSAGAELKLAGGVTLIGKFDGEFVGRAQTLAGTGTVRWTW